MRWQVGEYIFDANTYRLWGDGHDAVLEPKAASLLAYFCRHPDRSIGRDKLRGILSKGMPWLKRVEIFSRPRLAILCTSRVGRTAIGLTIALLSVSMMIPIPGTNTVPAMGIFAIGFGLLDDDGFISIIGLTIGAIGLALTTLILRYGYEAVSAGIDAIEEFVKGAF